MTKVPYQISGSGKTTAAADKDFNSKKSALEKRVGETIKPDSIVYLAKFMIKTNVNLSKAESTEFNIRKENPKEAWQEVLMAAEKRAKPLGLDDYAGSFSIEANYKITKQQAEESRKAHGTPSACGDERRNSSLDVLRRLY